MKTLALFALPVLLAAVTAGAAGQERGERTPEQLYEASCAYCHGPGGWGTRALAKRYPAVQAELLGRENLPAALTKRVVRRGIGSMPQLTPTDMTDEELDRLARWLDERT